MKNVWLLVLTCICMTACRTRQQSAEVTIYDLTQIKDSGELVALTLNSSTSYFDYRGEPMGFQYELADQFTRSLGVKLKIKVAQNARDLVHKLLQGEGDLIDDNLPVTKDQYEQIAAAIPSEIEENYKSYCESYKKPMPFYIGVPQIDNGKLRLNWDAAYDFEARDIRYTVELARDYAISDVLIKAEDVLLQGNPLKEAISSARFLFSRFLLGGILLREGNPDTVAVAGWRKEMEEALAVARSHTRGMTEEERRLWQAFLDKADLFPRTVAQGQEDAFSNATRRQLNLVLQEAQEAYNAFVEAHNRRDAASR